MGTYGSKIKIDSEASSIGKTSDKIITQVCKVLLLKSYGSFPE